MGKTLGKGAGGSVPLFRQRLYLFPHLILCIGGDPGVTKPMWLQGTHRNGRRDRIDIGRGGAGAGRRSLRPDRHIVAVGDAMLDRNHECVTDRISPEAPALVLRVLQTYDWLGGGANDAPNIAMLGIRVTMLAIVGDDSIRPCAPEDAGAGACHLPFPARGGIANHHEDARPPVARLPMP